MLKNSQDARGQGWRGSIPYTANHEERNDVDEYFIIDCPVYSVHCRDNMNRTSNEGELQSRLNVNVRF